MRYCIVNLTRLGDLLQTQPVISALKAEGHLVSLVCLENFAGAAELLRGLDRVSVLPGAALLARCDQSWPLAVGLLRQWVEAEQAEWPADCVLNLTAGLSARLLSKLVLLPGKKLLGFGLDEFGFGINATPWATYVQAASSRRACSPFNLVDGFRSMAECEHIPPKAGLNQPPQAVLEKVRLVLETELGKAVGQKTEKGAAGLIGFQLGASEERRSWPTAHFAGLAADLWEKYALVPVLLGSTGEKNLAEHYARHASTPFIDRIGQTNLEELAASLLCCRLLITNDTGTMHLAAGLGLPILALFFATAQPWDTGPYAEGLCCLEPRLPCHPCGFGEQCPHELACRSSIAPATVAELAGNFLTTGQWQARPEALARCRAWVSCRPGHEHTQNSPYMYSAPEPDAHFFLDLVALPSLPLADPKQQEAELDRHAWLRWQRVFYRQLLDQLSAIHIDQPPAEQPSGGQKNGAPGQPTLFGPLKNRFPLSGASTTRVCAAIAQFDDFLHLLIQQISLLQKPLPAALLSRSQATFLGACQRASAFLEQCTDFTPLYHLWQVMLQDKGADLNQLAQFLQTLREQLEFFAQALDDPAASVGK